MTVGLTPPFGLDFLKGPARLALVESEPKREARMRRLGRLANLQPENLAVYLGPGVQRAALWAKLFGCRTIVVDSDAVALAALKKEAGELGVAKLVEVYERDPLQLKRPEIKPSADLLFAQGLAMAVGFDAAVEGLRPLILEDGLLAIYQRAWFTPKVPDEVRSYWSARTIGSIRTVRETLERLHQLGFESMTCELIPAPAWDEHYERAEAQLAALASGAGPATELGKALADLREELRIHQAGGKTSTSLGCFVGRRREPGTPPRWPRRGFGD